jgi:hypothetical protein
VLVWEAPGQVVPESYLLNTRLGDAMKSIGIELEWPPIESAVQVAFAGVGRSTRRKSPGGQGS